MRKIWILLAILGIAIVFNVVCPQLETDQHGIEFHSDGNCTFLSHSIVHIGIGLSFLTLPLIGLFLLISIFFAPQLFVSAPFKPPRFHS
jgi:hypothetical protein